MMMVEKDQDLGLSLSLGFASNNHQSPLQLNLMPSLMVASSPPPSGCKNINKISQKPSWINESFISSDPKYSSDSSRAETRSFLREIDMNRLPSSAVNHEVEAVVSSPNSTISSVSGKRSEREVRTGMEEHESTDRACSIRNSDEEDGDISRKRLRLSKEQSIVLEEIFKEHNTLNPKKKMALAKQLGLRPRQVEVWFQNRRARTKLKQTELDCEYLKRCRENLTDENRRLQKQVQELRALKLSPQFYMEMTPPTTFTMCLSCERVGVPSTDPRAQLPKMGPPIHHRFMSINPWAPGVKPSGLKISWEG